MYRIPLQLDLSKVVGQITTQVLVGQSDLQFSFGEVHFAVESNIDLMRNEEVIGTWRAGIWPPPEFFEIMNIEVSGCEIPNNRKIIIRLENGIEIHLHDDSDQFECMQITFEGEADQWII